MPTSTTFLPPAHFRHENSSYSFLPFRFKRLGKDSVLITNLAGEFRIISVEEFQQFSSKTLDNKSELYNALRRKQFLADQNSPHFDLLASKIYTKKSAIRGFTKLHIFVLTLRCNCACTYCQVTRQASEAGNAYDMTPEAARKAVDLMLRSPSPDITVEFQGGEPLLNFSVLKEVVLYSEQANANIGKKLSYVVCTNLSLLTDEMLDFFQTHKVAISTSLDGPAELHDYNRCRTKKAACHKVLETNIRRAREALGKCAVSALMTTTRQSLPFAKEIIDEYLRLDMGSIFIRALNPYGYAVKTEKAIGYSAPEFVKFYKQCFAYIMDVNRTGATFPEAYTALLLRKILAPWSVGFVDLQSPTGNGFAVTVYNYDGDVYASDESRMLYEMGDPTFRLGSALTDTYEEIYFGQAMQLIANNGIAECLAGCSDCAFVPYCGADPVRHYATQKDPYGHRPSSSFCQKNSKIFEFLFNFLQNISSRDEEILWSWIRNASVEEMSLSGESNAC